MIGNKRIQNFEFVVTDVTLRKSEIPEYCKQGELYRTLMENNDDPNEEVTFLANVVKPNIRVNNIVDCDQLLNSLRFWGVDGAGFSEFIAYVLTCCKSREKIDTMLQKYETEFKFVHWLRRVFLARPCDQCRVAIRSGLIELVEPFFSSVLSNKSFRLPADACAIAAEVGNVEMLNFLCKNGCKIDQMAGSRAARNGHPSILQFILQNGYIFDGNDLKAAIEGGHMNCVQFICSSFSPDQKESSRACNTATMHGHLEILKLLHNEGFGWGVNATIVAAGGGHLHCLQYLHEHGCPWMRYTCAVAAGRGHLRCLQYAHQHGAPFNNDVAVSAVDENQYDCLQYAHEHGCVWTYMETTSPSHVVFELEGLTLPFIRTQYKSSPVWEYLRMHAQNV